ncbi:MarR family winged helix-turn-helix transcriptional regulator [Pleionea sp. CnH1-48]|uniref:MarR family winged helix-turn-helix transcriptional regulator n=1 Tax=Pleionea sp. CnH1-48 TaxID=2954494 RepID=UPI0020972E9B|nr:helix-turn-helix domain-containing protein [Pleionea sp. CnH1-48]MCO7223270.1 MarR family transcriptional regulator [Pleionea sp. CnH1-48]
MQTIDLSNKLKTLLLQRLEWMEQMQLDLMNESGIQQLTLAQGRIFAQLRGKPSSISNLAKRLGVSRQAAQKTVASLVELGLLELKEDEENLSAKIVHITQQGQQFRQQIGIAMDKVEAAIADKIGVEQVELLKQLLSEPWE